MKQFKHILKEPAIKKWFVPVLHAHQAAKKLPPSADRRKIRKAIHLAGMWSVDHISRYYDYRDGETIYLTSLLED